MNQQANPATVAGEAASPDGTRPLADRGRAVGEDAGRLAEDLGLLAAEVERFLAHRVEHSPYGTLAAAAGTGYVLGGGVPPWLLRVGLAVGARAVGNVLLKGAFAAFAGPGAGTGGPSEPGGDVPPPHS